MQNAQETELAIRFRRFSTKFRVRVAIHPRTVKLSKLHAPV